MATRALVRSPAICARHWRSTPISAPNPSPVARRSPISRVVMTVSLQAWRAGRGILPLRRAVVAQSLSGGVGRGFTVRNSPVTRTRVRIRAAAPRAGR